MIDLSTQSTAVPTGAAGVVRLAVHPGSEWAHIAPVWRRLFQESSARSVFLSPAWTETWLEAFGRDLGVSILLFECSEEPVAVCLIVESCRRRAALRFRRLSLNTSGEGFRESTYIEYNDILCRPGYEPAVADALAEYLSVREWDELALDGLSNRWLIETLRQRLRACDLEQNEQPCYHIDLAALRRAGTSYAASLRSGYRKTLKRNVDAYCRIGELRIESAASVEEALAMFDELATLNRRRWAGRRSPSSFEAPSFVAFHRALIARSYDEGLIQIIRLRAGDRTVGILYNFVLDGRVNFYQCGYDYEIGEHLSPGIITHAYMVQHALTCGLDDWDCLAGESLFKRSLSSGARRLVWATFRRRNPKTLALRLARVARRGLRALRSAKHSRR